MENKIRRALERDQIDQALQRSEEWTRAQPHLPRAHRWHAIALQRQDRVPDAVDAMRRAVALAPDDIDLHAKQASLLLALRHYQRRQMATLLMEADVALARGDLDAADLLTTRARALEPGNADVDAMHGLIKLHRHDAAGAFAALNTAAQSRPDDPLLLYALGLTALGREMPAIAEQIFMRAASMDAGIAALPGLLAHSALQHRDAAAALAHIEAALTQPGQATPALRRMAAELALGARQFDRILELLLPPLAEHADDPQALQLLLTAWQQLQLPAQARYELDAVLSDKSGSDNLWRARMSVEDTGSNAAMTVVDRWIAAKPDHVPALEARTRLHDLRNEPESAEVVARRIISLEPTHAAAQTRLVDRLMLRDTAGAVAHVEALIEKAEGSRRLDLRTWLGEVHDRAGNPEAALNVWLDIQADMLKYRLDLPPQSMEPSRWPAMGDASPPTGPRPMFLWGPPGAGAERVMKALAEATPLVRHDRFGPTPPRDAFQEYTALQQLVTREVTPAAMIERWRKSLPLRGVDGDAVIDWLPFWDNGLLYALRPALPEGRLLFVIRDPRDMLLDWIAYGSAAKIGFPGVTESTAWLARALDQIAVLSEQNLYPHLVVRIDTTLEDPEAMAQLLSQAFNTHVPPTATLGPQRLPAGHWRRYRGVLADAFAVLSPTAVRLGYPQE